MIEIMNMDPFAPAKSWQLRVLSTTNGAYSTFPPRQSAARREWAW